MNDGQSAIPESTAVQTHLKMVQDVIARMGDNSRACKFWCVTLVAATLVLVAQDGGANSCSLGSCCQQ